MSDPKEPDVVPLDTPVPESLVPIPEPTSLSPDLYRQIVDAFGSWLPFIEAHGFHEAVKGYDLLLAAARAELQKLDAARPDPQEPK